MNARSLNIDWRSEVLYCWVRLLKKDKQSSKSLSYTTEVRAILYLSGSERENLPPVKTRISQLCLIIASLRSAFATRAGKIGGRSCEESLFDYGPVLFDVDFIMDIGEAIFLKDLKV